MSYWTNATFLVRSPDLRNAVTPFLLEFTKVCLAMICRVRSGMLSSPSCIFIVYNLQERFFMLKDYHTVIRRNSQLENIFDWTVRGLIKWILNKNWSNVIELHICILSMFLSLLEICTEFGRSASGSVNKSLTSQHDHKREQLNNMFIGNLNIIYT